MKLLGYNLRSPFTRLSTQEKFKGYIDTHTGQTKGPRTFNVGEHNWHERCKYFDALSVNHGLAKSIATTISGQLMAEGVFTVENDLIHKEQSKQATEAKEEIDRFNLEIGLEPMLYDAAMLAVKHGSVFFEADQDAWDVRLIPFQENIEPYKQDAQGEITDWCQSFNNVRSAFWNAEANEIFDVSWDKSSLTWPFGTSLYCGMDVDFETLSQLKLDIKEYMHNNAFPMEVYAIGDGQFTPADTDLAAIRSLIKVMQPGQKIITSYPIDHRVGGTGDREVKGIDTVLGFVKEEIIDGGGVPPISKQYNSTEASAKEMMPAMMANYIIPLQRIISRTFEEHVYKPYLESLGYSVRLCPKLLFAPPDQHKLEDAQYWSSLIQAGLPAAYAWEEMGFDLEHIQELQEENDARMLEQQKLQMALNPEGGSASFGAKPKPQEEKPKSEAKELMLKGKKWTVIEGDM